ncbi:Fcf2 pre-rRNA processing-domain-containing protein [Usnea florida]
MAIPRARTLLRSENWKPDELSEMRSLLQRAEQRMKKLNPASNSSIEDKNSFTSPQLNSGPIPLPYITSTAGIARADRTRLVNEKDQQMTVFHIQDPPNVKEDTRKEKPTAGPSWFDMPRTKLDHGLKSDLKLLKLRNVLDPHRHYRSDATKVLVPEFSQTGQIIEGPAEYFSSRLPNKHRKRTFIEEVLANEKLTGRFKKKYSEIQASKASGRKAYYKKMKERKSKGLRKS